MPSMVPVQTLAASILSTEDLACSIAPCLSQFLMLLMMMAPGRHTHLQGAPLPCRPAGCAITRGSAVHRAGIGPCAAEVQHRSNAANR